MGQVYIEDYVVSFLKQKKLNAGNAPIKIALYGYVEKEDDKEDHVIYGAACEEEGRTAEEIGSEFFPSYYFVGYVNVHNSEAQNEETQGALTWKSEYHIFFDENIAMQDYLLFYNARNEEGKMELFQTDVRSGNKESSHAIWDRLKLLLFGCLCIAGAVAVSTIDDYSKMKDFGEAVGQVIEFIEETG